MCAIKAQQVVCVCLCVFMYVCMYVCMYVFIYILYSGSMCMSVCLNMFYLQRTSQACMPGCIHTYVYSSVEGIQYHLNPNRDIGIENQNNPRLWKGQNQKNEN